jgi:hypothetical protein
MRPDMPQLLVERGHSGRSWSPRQPKGWTSRCRFRDGEDDPREAWLPPRYRPSFSENLNPLRRYLAAQVGRPWDKVYAEIRSRIDTGNAVQYHILQHLYDRLAVKVWEDDQGRLFHQGSWGRPETIDARWSRVTMYVCPRTGLLRKLRRRERVAPTAPITRLAGDGPCHDYQLLAGQWYEAWWGNAATPPHARIIVRKRQLSRRELRDLGLRD